MKTTKQAAEFLKVNQSRVRKLIADGRIVAVKVGRDWIIDDAELQRFADRDRDRRVHWKNWKGGI